MDLLSLPKVALRTQYRLIRLPLTAAELLAERNKTPKTHDEVARKGLVEGALGFGKELIGTVLGQDDLAAEGRLQHAKASEEREAAINEVLADTKRQRAEREYAKDQTELDRERAKVEAEKAAKKARLAQERAERKRAADTAVDVREKAARRAAQTKKAQATAKQRRAERERTAKVARAAQHEDLAEAAIEKAEALARARTRT